MYNSFTLPHPTSRHARSLQEFLASKQRELQAEITKDAPQLAASNRDETAYVQSLIKKYTLDAPQLDAEHIQKTLNYKDGSDMFGRTIKVPFVTFSVPFRGKIELLQYLPRSGSSSLSSPHFTLQGSSICFEVESPTRNTEETRTRKEQILTSLQQRIDGILPELQEYNRGIKDSVMGLIQQQEKQHSADNDFLSQL